MRLFDVLLSLAGIAGVAWILWLTLIDGRRRRLPPALLIAAGIDAICGLANLLLGGAHFLAVVGRAFRGHGAQGSPVFSYDFRFYSLLMLGLLLVVPGTLCVRSARGITNGEAAAWRVAFWSSVVLLVVNGPLVLLQDFAILLGALALVNVVVLPTVRQRIVDT